MLRAVEFDASGAEVDTRTYADLDKAIENGDAQQSEVFKATTLMRWEFGKRLLAEREANGGKQLPNGRLDELSEELGRGKTELAKRMRLAEVYSTSQEVCDASQTFGSWREIIAAFPPKRQPKPAPKKADVVFSDGTEAAPIRVPKLETSHCGDCGGSFPVSELTEDQDGTYELCPDCLDKDEHLRVEKPWRFVQEEPDEQQEANWRSSFERYQIITNGTIKGLRGKRKQDMIDFLKSVVESMEEDNG